MECLQSFELIICYPLRAIVAWDNIVCTDSCFVDGVDLVDGGACGVGAVATTSTKNCPVSLFINVEVTKHLDLGFDREVVEHLYNPLTLRANIVAAVVNTGCAILWNRYWLAVAGESVNHVV